MRRRWFFGNIPRRRCKPDTLAGTGERRRHPWDTGNLWPNVGSVRKMARCTSAGSPGDRTA